MSKTKIIVSSNSGFCFGVERALNIAESALKRGKPVYSLGPIIHNPQVVDEFSRKGLKIAKDLKKIDSENTALLVPSHGINPRIIKNKKFTFIDTTCPLVRKVQNIIKKLKKEGYFIVIVGNRHHPEVRGLTGIAGRFSSVVKGRKEARALNLKPKKIALISQTTSSILDFKKVLVEMAKKDFTELAVFNTVCRNTIERQQEAGRIAGKVDAMIVIGGRQSANTLKLAASCRKANKRTYYVESGKDLNAKFFRSKKSIGIVTGASTPPYAIREIIGKISDS